MAEFRIVKTPSGGYVIFAPKRSKRPDESENFTIWCPFCIGNENQETEVFRIGGIKNDPHWQVRVIPNKFPFAPIHEIIIHSPDHHKNFDELPLEQVEIIFEVFQQRYLLHKENGTVFLFHNHGEMGGESLPHPHSQLVVYPKEIDLSLPEKVFPTSEVYETDLFILHAPLTSQWPDELWILPKQSNRTFGQINEVEKKQLAYVLQRLVQIYTFRHGHEFPYNFYIYPWKNWYLRFIPRDKKLGGIEIVSNIFINTGDPNETMDFIRKNF